ncbi:hypothetical protein D3C85_1549230 [compost metagenome]
MAWPLTVHTQQQLRQVRFRVALGFVLRLGPLDHRVTHKSGDVTTEALRHGLALLDGKIRQFQGLLELLGVEQPDQNLHQHQVRVVQTGFAVALHVH